MPKAIWRGNIAFGLIVLPIKLYSATEPKLVSFHLLCPKCKSRLQYKRWCAKCKAEVSWDSVLHGFEYVKGKYVTFNREELHRLPIPQSKNIEIIEFVDSAEIDPLFYDKNYFIVPEKGAEKAFSLLKEALQLANIVAVGKVVMRDRDYLVVLRGYKNTLLLTTLFYSDEIRKPEFFAELTALPKASKQELKLAAELIAKLTKHFNLSEFKNKYKEILRSFIEAKLEGKKVEIPTAKPTKDLMVALEASLKMAKAKAKTKNE
ncbi:MAG: Ku protein [Candidatus Nanoarchaeia archaeon]